MKRKISVILYIAFHIALVVNVISMCLLVNVFRADRHIVGMTNNYEVILLAFAGCVEPFIVCVKTAFISWSAFLATFTAFNVAISIKEKKNGKTKNRKDDILHIQRQ